MRNRELTPNQQLASDWVDWFLENEPNLINIKAYHGIIIGDVHYVLELNKHRMMHNIGAERQCAYTRIRNFKYWYLNTYKNG
jgi:hypothetical protein